MTLRYRFAVLCALFVAMLGGAGQARAALLIGSVINVQMAGGGTLTEYVHAPGTGSSIFERVSMGPYALKVPAGSSPSSWMCFDVVPTVSAGQTCAKRSDRAAVHRPAGRAALRRSPGRPRARRPGAPRVRAGGPGRNGRLAEEPGGITHALF